jgi:hypothetical protein
MPRARAATRATQRQEQEKAACKKERRIRRRERWEQQDEEYRLREQQGLSPLSDSGELIVGRGGGRGERQGAPPERWNPPPPSPRVAEAAEEQAHFNEAQAELALWQEFRDHDTSLNSALNEALRIHAGLAWQIFKVRVLIIDFKVFPCRFCVRAFLDFAFFHTLSAVDRSWRTELGRGMTASIS